MTAKEELLTCRLDDLLDRYNNALETIAVYKRILAEAREGWIEVYPPRDGWITINRLDIINI